MKYAINILLSLTIPFLLLFEPSECQDWGSHDSGRGGRGRAGSDGEVLDTVNEIIGEYAWAIVLAPLAILATCLGCACCCACICSNSSDNRQPHPQRYKNRTAYYLHPESSAVLVSTPRAGWALGERSPSRFVTEYNPANISPHRPRQQHQPYGYQPTEKGTNPSFSSPYPHDNSRRKGNQLPYPVTNQRFNPRSAFVPHSSQNQSTSQSSSVPHSSQSQSTSQSSSVPHSSQSQSTSQSYSKSQASEGKGYMSPGEGCTSTPPSAPHLELKEYLDAPPPAYDELN